MVIDMVRASHSAESLYTSRRQDDGGHGVCRQRPNLRLEKRQTTAANKMLHVRRWYIKNPRLYDNNQKEYWPSGVGVGSGQRSGIHAL